MNSTRPAPRLQAEQTQTLHRTAVIGRKQRPHFGSSGLSLPAACAGVRLAVRRRDEVEHGVVAIGWCDRLHEPVGPRFAERECLPLVLADHR